MVFDRYPIVDRVSMLGDRVTLISGDVNELQEILDVLKTHKVDKIIHLASIPGSPLAPKLLPYFRVQCMGSANLFDAARLAGVRRVVNGSTISVYGTARDQSLGEEDAPKPEEIYGASKLWIEHAAALYNNFHSMEVLSLRITATMGYGAERPDPRLQQAMRRHAPH